MNVASAVRSALHRGAAVPATQNERPAAPSEALSHEIASLLARGEYARGFAALESIPSTNLTGLPVPRWNGRAFRGVMAVVPDDGLGDQIMFARLIRFIKSRGSGPVVVLTPKPLARLLRRVQGVDDVFPIDRVPGGHVNVDLPWRPDWYVRITSLPRIFGVRPDSIPTAPYISADPEDIARWRDRVPRAGLRVGVVWRGDPNLTRDATRSLPSIAALSPLWTVPGVSFVSLQVGAGEAEARSWPLPLTHLGSELRDFADTAAILSQLDLLISVDTSTANLAGAMGLPTWVLVPQATDFRWLHGWYPSARLFQQRTPGDWSGPVQDAAAALAQLL